VMEKVKEQFGKDVFEAVIRYTIRLRETVDCGLPISDYDKHAIGNKDYDTLAEELIRSAADASREARPGAMNDTHSILQKTGAYIESVTEAAAAGHSEGDAEEFAGTGLRSSYSEMIEVLATDPPLSALGGDDGE
jgi:hypothetical protein